MKERGFDGKNGMYRIQKSSTIGVIGFQRSVDSTLDQIKFTANIGIASKCILAFEDWHDAEKIEPEECHWLNRLGFCAKSPYDIWWTVSESTNIESLGFELTSLIDQRLLPEMMKFMNEECLLDLWGNGQCKGITEFQRLQYLCILAKHYNKKYLLSNAKKRLVEYSANKPIASSTAVFLRQLESFGQ